MSSTGQHLSPAGTVSYHEPSLARLLTLISFVYLANVARDVADYTLGAGLLGQVAVGVVYGPVAKILPLEWQETFLSLGYVGLCLIVFEGGLTLDLASFLPLLPLSIVSALVGILLPLALTFALFSSPLFSYPPLEAFTAGSALASTSLGTTFFVLKSAGGPRLEQTKIAQVLKGAALADDIVALVLLSVISSLAGGADASLGWTIGRPIVASVAMCLVAPVVILYLLRPLFIQRRVREWVEKSGPEGKLSLGVAVLSAYLAIAYYAGTTVLLGAFLAGVTLPFLAPTPPTSPSSDPSRPPESPSFLETYELYIAPIQNYVLVPLFFGSIGFSIPFLELWQGRIVWRGIVYAVLMTLGKVLVGFCVLANDAMFSRTRSDASGSVDQSSGKDDDELESAVAATTFAERARSEPATLSTTNPASASSRSSFVRETLPAAGFLGLALVARGEIGVLVLQVAYNSNAGGGSEGGSTGSSVLETEPYLVAIWAVLVCTIVGPVAFARVVKSEWGRNGVLRGRWS
ncbi:hypothetical protein JCM11491_001429 [Sporobolomyces phaffii]